MLIEAILSYFHFILRQNFIALEDTINLQMKQDFVFYNFLTLPQSQIARNISYMLLFLE